MKKLNEKYRRLFLTCIVITCLGVTGNTSTRYYTIHNNFGSIECTDGTVIIDDFLTCDNTTTSDIILRDTTLINGDSFRIQARMANSHNSPRRSYTVTDNNGNRHRIDNPSWGIAFDITDDKEDYWAVTMQCHNTNINDDISNRQYAQIILLHHYDNEDHIISEARCDKGVNLNNGFNSIEVKVNTNEITVAVGTNELTEVIHEQRITDRQRTTHAGCIIGAGAKIRIERMVVSVTGTETISTETGWSNDRLKEYFEQSTDPVEGFWIYQDRDMEDRWLRLGGRYTVAIIAKDNGYDIIYIDGATTKRELWHPGMLKGHMTRTIFGNHYDLMWVDATLQPITQDAYASIENGILLTLKFPVYKSQLRLSKILNP